MRVVSALLGILLVVVGGAAIHFWREAEAGRRQVAELQAQLQERQLQAVTPALASVVQPATPAAAAAGDMAPATPPAPASSAALAVEAAALTNRMEVIRAGIDTSSPEAVARRRQTTRLLLAGSNPDIDEALGLSPEEGQKLLDMLAAHQEGMSEAFGFGKDNATVSPQDRAARVRERQQANEAELQAMLGSKYAQWQDYSQTRVAWQQRRDLRAVLNAAGAPLTDAQDRSLIAALSTEHRSINQERNEAAAQSRSGADVLFVRYTPEGRQRLLDAAAPHLSPQQLEGYRGMLERAAAQEQLTAASMRAAAEAAAAAQR